MTAFDEEFREKYVSKRFKKLNLFLKIFNAFLRHSGMPPYLRLISSRSRVTSPAIGELVSSSMIKKKDGHKKIMK